MHLTLPSKAEVFGANFADYYDNEDRYIVEWGGRAGAKSTRACRKAILKCLHEDYYRCIITRKVYSDIKDSIYQTIKDEIISGGFEHLFTFRVSPLEIECVNGNKFIARGFDRPDKTKSVKDPTDIIYEEANEISEQDFITTTTSVRTLRARYLQETIIFNPEVNGDPEDHWLYKTFFKGQTGRSFRTVKAIDIDGETYHQSVTVIHTTYHDNIQNIAPDFIAKLESLKETNRYFYDVYTLGEWGQKQVQNQFANWFDEGKHVSDKAIFNPHLPIYISMDFNLEPFGFILKHKWQDQYGYHSHQFDEATIENGDIEMGIQWLRDKYGHFAFNFIITGDAMGSKRDFGRSDKHSYYQRIMYALKLKKSQIETHANPQHSKSRTDLNYVLLNFDEYIIHPDCKNTIRDLQSVECDATGSIIKTNRKKISERADHLDCVRYDANDRFFQSWIKMHMKTGGAKAAKLYDPKPLNKVINDLQKQHGV